MLELILPKLNQEQSTIKSDKRRPPKSRETAEHYTYISSSMPPIFPSSDLTWPRPLPPPLLLLAPPQLVILVPCHPASPASLVRFLLAPCQLRSRPPHLHLLIRYLATNHRPSPR